MDITDKLKELAKARNELEECKKDVEHNEIELKLRVEYRALETSKEWYSKQKEVVEELEKEIRILLNLHFGLDETRNKKPFPGTEIKEFSVIKVLDEKKALIWASQNAPSILKLDQTKFKKAVENLELDFVEKGVEYRGQIASDLSEYLK